MSPTHAMFALVAIAGVAALIASFLYGGEKKIVGHRKSARKLADELGKQGLSLLSKCFADLADGDLIGLDRSIHEARDTMLDPKKRDADFQHVFDVQLEARFKDPDQRAALLKKVDALRAAAGVSTSLDVPTSPVALLSPGRIDAVSAPGVNDVVSAALQAGHTLTLTPPPSVPTGAPVAAAA